MKTEHYDKTKNKEEPKYNNHDNKNYSSYMFIFDFYFFIDKHRSPKLRIVRDYTLKIL